MSSTDKRLSLAVDLERAPHTAGGWSNVDGWTGRR